MVKTQDYKLDQDSSKKTVINLEDTGILSIEGNQYGSFMITPNVKYYKRIMFSHDIILHKTSEKRPFIEFKRFYSIIDSEYSVIYDNFFFKNGKKENLHYFHKCIPIINTYYTNSYHSLVN